MNRLFVLGNVAYAAKVGGGVITGYDEADELAEGAIAFLNEKGLILTAANAAANVADSKYVTAIVGRSVDTNIVAMIPRQKLTDLNLVNYRAATKQVITVGGITAPLTLNFTNEGTATMVVKDSTYTSKNLTRQVNATVYKPSYMTEEELVDAMVLQLNKPDSFIVAAKVKDGTSTYFGITITPKEDDTFVEVAVGDMWQGSSRAVTTAGVHSIGKGKDILQMEKDFSVEEGNGNYIDYTSEWYSRVMQANPNAAFDVITLTWEGVHTSPSRSHNVMLNRLAIACLTTADSGQADTDIMALLALIFGNAFTATSGAEPATDDGTDTDGISGN